MKIFGNEQKVGAATVLPTAGGIAAFGLFVWLVAFKGADPDSASAAALAITGSGALTAAGGFRQWRLGKGDSGAEPDDDLIPGGGTDLT